MKGFVGWQKEGTDIKTKYTLEFVDNIHDWDKICSDKHPAPWELYKKRETFDLQEAINGYCGLCVRDDIYDAKMFAEIYLDDELIQEYNADNFDHWMIKRCVNKTLTEERDTLRQQNDDVEKENELFRKYLRQYTNGMDRFWDFCKEQRKEVE